MSTEYVHKVICMRKEEWTKEKIEEYVSQGWTLSYDRSNDRYKLAKRIGKKIKSYSLPKRFNEFCSELKEKTVARKPISYWMKKLDEEPLCYIKEEYNLDWLDLENIFEKYVEYKAKELSPEEVARMALYAYIFVKEVIGFTPVQERLNQLELKVFKDMYPTG